MYNNPDPYGVSAWEDEQEEFTMSEQVSPQELWYEELLGAYHSMPVSDNPHSSTYNEDQWNALNSIMDKLVTAGYPDYAELKITPSRAGNAKPTVSVVTLRMKTMSALRRMGREFGCGNPAYDLSRYGTAASVSVSQQANPTNNSSAYQEQNQHQEQSMSIEQSIDLAVEKIRQDYGDEKATQAREQLESLKSNKSWDNVKSVIKFFADIGKQAFVAVSPVIAAALIASAL